MGVFVHQDTQKKLPEESVIDLSVASSHTCHGRGSPAGDAQQTTSFFGKSNGDNGSHQISMAGENNGEHQISMAGSSDEVFTDKPPDRFIYALIATIFCFPIGAFALHRSLQCRKATRYGHLLLAEEHSRFAVQFSNVAMAMAMLIWRRTRGIENKLNVLEPELRTGAPERSEDYVIGESMKPTKNKTAQVRFTTS
ncbi:hypothetical protein LSAT2_001510 [Lamellibrachia satsuma]|nr:hypothetical protein LSAT2_001510 [Lamellibrachia satsuma]